MVAGIRSSAATVRLDFKKDGDQYMGSTTPCTVTLNGETSKETCGYGRLRARREIGDAPLEARRRSGNW